MMMTKMGEQLNNLQENFIETFHVSQPSENMHSRIISTSLEFPSDDTNDIPLTHVSKEKGMTTWSPNDH